MKNTRDSAAARLVRIGAPISRRRFIGQASCAAVGAVPLINTILNLKLAGSVAAAEPGAGEYRALVCLFLNGGNDSFNMLVPHGAAHAAYANVRGDLALPDAGQPGGVLPIDPLGDPGLPLAVHPSMPELQQLFDQGSACFVSNVGTLVEPTSKADFLAGTATLPLGLFSHSDQIEQWQTSLPDTRTGVGWAGRMADLLKDLNGNDKVSMNISLSGSNVWQTGQSVFEYAITSGGAVGLQGYQAAYTNNNALQQIRSAAVDSQMAQTYSNLFAETFAKAKRDAVAAYDLFSTATNVALPGGATFPDTTLGHQFQMVAKVIAGRLALDATRQTFFIGYGGWDHHDEVVGNQQVMLGYVSQAVGAFHNAMVQLGLQDQVAVFSASDFGRTLTSNGQGSDHAWGGNHFVVGGGVNGQRIWGQYPNLADLNTLDVGRGRLIPAISVDEYFAELALWLGVSKASLPLVLPNIGRFYNTAGADWPVGFMA